MQRSRRRPHFFYLRFEKHDMNFGKEVGGFSLDFKKYPPETESVGFELIFDVFSTRVRFLPQNLRRFLDGVHFNKKRCN